MTELRLATEADFDEMLALLDDVAQEKRWLGTEPGFDRALYRKNWCSWIKDASDLFLVAVESKRIVGHLVVHGHIEFGPTLGMLVDENFRGQGVGRALLEYALDWARRRGLRTLHLLVFPHNAAAIALYRSVGFVDVERFERDVTRSDGQVWDTLLMRVTLR